VLRFFANLEAWRRIIDDAVADPASGIDGGTRRTQGRGTYPLPTKLREEWYSGYNRIWVQVQAAGIIIKDKDPSGAYVPDIGRPQHYRLNILEGDV